MGKARRTRKRKACFRSSETSDGGRLYQHFYDSYLGEGKSIYAKADAASPLVEAKAANIARAREGRRCTT